MKKRLLFVCFSGGPRSKIAVDIFANDERYEAKSSGVSTIYSKEPLTVELLGWADIIFAMEESHKETILKNFPKETKGKKIFVLDVENDAGNDEERLKRILKERLNDYL